MYSDPAIRNEILEKKHLVEERKKDIHYLLRSLFDTALDSEALQHSLRIEVPLDQDIGLDKEHYKQENLQEAANNLRSAWRYGKNHFDIPFRPEFLIKLAYTVEPDLAATENGWRKMAVRPKGAKVTPPYPAKLPLVMERYFDTFEALLDSCAVGKDYKDCFDVGAWLHFQLARIHPFEDGNGRTSRLVHNLYLSHLDNYPPVVIREDERDHYIRLLGDADVGFKERDGEIHVAYNRASLSEPERHYYDYMAGKLNQSLDVLLSRH